MSTGRIIIPFPGGSPAGATDSCSWRKVAGANAISNGAASFTIRANFNDSTDQHWIWSFMMPGDYVSGGTVKIKWGSDATTGNVVWKAAIATTIDNSTDTDSGTTFQFNATTTSGAVAVPGTTGQIKQTSITPSQATTPITAECLFLLMLGRDADDGTNDTSVGNAWITGALFEYTAS